MLGGSVCTVESEDSVPVCKDMYISTRMRDGRRHVKVSILLDTGAGPNLIGLTTLSSFGKRLPDIKRPEQNLKIKGASGDPLEVMGTTQLHIKIGQRERLVKFHVVKNMVTSALLGLRELRLMGTHILCDQGVVRFGMVNSNSSDKDYTTLKLHDSRPIAFRSSRKHIIKPGESVYVTCNAGKCPIVGSYLATFHANDDDQVALSQLIDVKRDGVLDVLIGNNSDKIRIIDTNQLMGQIRPVRTDSIQLIDQNIVNNLIDQCMTEQPQTEAVFNVCKKKSKRSRPQFSKPIESEDDKLSDIELIRKQIKFNDDLLSNQQKEQLIQLVYDNRKAFSLRGEIGESKSAKYEIKMKPDAQYFFRQSYKLSDFEAELMKQEITKLLKLGIIAKSSRGYAPFVSPALLTCKQDGSSRFLSDFRLLNKQTKTDHYSFQSIPDILRKIGKLNGKYMAVFDVKDSFFQIPLTENSKELTTFTPAPNELYHYLRTPQGYKSSPTALARHMQNLLGDLAFVITYADDVIVISKSIHQHFSNLKSLFKRISDDNLKLNLSKSIMINDEVEFCGHNLKDGYIRPLDKHRQNILNMKKPTDKQGLKRLLGSVTWLSKFIPNHSKLTHELFKLLRKNVQWNWLPIHDKAFKEIVSYFSNETVLKLPTGKGTYHLFVDACKTGLGSCLLEKIGNKYNVVGFASRNVLKSEQKSSATDLEIMALKMAFKQFRQLLYGNKPFFVYTDHYSLVHIMNGKTEPATKKIANCVSYISDFTFELNHVAGKHNDLADWISRDLPFSQDSPFLQESLVMTLSENVRRSSRIIGKSPELPGISYKGSLKNAIKQVTPSAQNSVQPNVESGIEPAVTSQPLPDTSHPNTEQLSNRSLRPERNLILRPQMEGVLTRSRMKANTSNNNILPKLNKHIDVQNNEAYGEPITFLPDPKPILGNKSEIKFSDRFHGSVPQRVRDSIKELVSKSYTTDLDSDDIRRHQRMCNRYRDIIRYIEEGYLPTQKCQAKRILNQDDSFVMIGKLLFRLPKIEDIDNPQKLRVQLVIPDSLADLVIGHHHSSVMGSCHAGYLKSLLNIRKKYYIANLGNKLKDYIDQCGSCLKLRETSKEPPTAPLQIAAGKTVNGPYQRLQIDHAGEFNSKYAFKHVLLITCEFTQYTWLFKTKTTGHEEVVNALQSLIRSHGIFKAISSDRGPAFTSKVLNALSRIYGNKWNHDLSHTPMSTGLVENRVGLLKNLLKFTMLRNANMDIMDAVDHVVFPMNATPSSVTSVSPHFCFFGFEPITPLDANLIPDLPGSPTMFVENLKNEISMRNALLKESKRLIAENRKYNFDKRIQDAPSFSIGDLVLMDVPNHPLSNKNMRKFKVKRAGPFKILEIDGMMALLADMQGNALNDLVSIRKLRKIGGYKSNFPIDVKAGGCANGGITNDNGEVINIIQIPVTVSHRKVERKGEMYQLIYPFDIEKSGTYVPISTLL